MDFNGDGAFTIWDIAYAIKVMYLFPAAMLIGAIQAVEPLAAFLEVADAKKDGVGAALLALPLWCLIGWLIESHQSQE